MQGDKRTEDAEPEAQEAPSGEAAQAGSGQGMQAGADGRQTAPGQIAAPDTAKRRIKEANPLRSLGAQSHDQHESSSALSRCSVAGSGSWRMFLADSSQSMCSAHLALKH